MFETDDDDFTPSQSSNLSSIFDISGVSDERSSLSYRAPKQPKASVSSDLVDSKNNTEQKVLPEAKSTVILAIPVTVWQFENGHNKLLGKHIVAVIGHTSPELYEMLLYQRKTDIIVRLPLNKLLTLYKHPSDNHPENFVSFFDSQKQFWNLNFETPENMNSFLTSAASCGCKIISQGETANSVKVPTIDLYPIEKNESSTEETDDFKNSILMKISKVGQQILPKIGHKKSVEVSDSETESSSSNSNSRRQTMNPKKSRRNQTQENISHSPTATANSIVQNHSSLSPIPINMCQTYSPLSPTVTGNNNIQNYPALNREIFLNNNQMALTPQNMLFPASARTPSYPDYGMNNVMMAQNAEIAVHLTEINHKLNSVLSAHKDKNGNDKNDENLKSRIKCLNLKIDNLTSDLENQTRLFEDLKIKYDRASSEIATLEEEKNRSCKVLVSKIEELQAELSSVRQLENENGRLKVNLEEQNELIGSQQLKLRELEDLWLENQESKKKFEDEKEKLNSRIEELTLQAEGLKNKENNNSRENDNSTADKKVINKKIKETMNQAFISIMDNFNENYDYNYHEIQQAVLKNLKETTFSLMNNLE